MPNFTLEQGKRYRAQIKLTFFESWASNNRVAVEVEKAGFSDVDVTGSGKTRIGMATWPNETRTVPLPDRIRNPIEV